MISKRSRIIALSAVVAAVLAVLGLFRLSEYTAKINRYEDALVNLAFERANETIKLVDQYLPGYVFSMDIDRSSGDIVAEYSMRSLHEDSTDTKGFTTRKSLDELFHGNHQIDAGIYAMRYSDFQPGENIQMEDNKTYLATFIFTSAHENQWTSLPSVEVSRVHTPVDESGNHMTGLTDECWIALMTKQEYTGDDIIACYKGGQDYYVGSISEYLDHEYKRHEGNPHNNATSFLDMSAIYNAIGSNDPSSYMNIYPNEEVDEILANPQYRCFGLVLICNRERAQAFIGDAAARGLDIELAQAIEIN